MEKTYFFQFFWNKKYFSWQNLNSTWKMLSFEVYIVVVAQKLQKLKFFAFFAQILLKQQAFLDISLIRVKSILPKCFSLFILANVATTAWKFLSVTCQFCTILVIFLSKYFTMFVLVILIESYCFFTFFKFDLPPFMT